MRRLLGRAALAGAVTLLALGPATVSRADEPVPTPTATAQPGSTTSSTDQAELDKILAEVRAELAESSEQMVLAACRPAPRPTRPCPAPEPPSKRTQQLLAEAQRRQEQTAHAARPRPRSGTRSSTQAAEETAAARSPSSRTGSAGWPARSTRAAARWGTSPCCSTRSPPRTSPSGWWPCRRSCPRSARSWTTCSHRAGVVRPADRRPRAGPRRLRGSRRAGPGGPAAGDRPGRRRPQAAVTRVNSPGRHPQGGARGRRAGPGRGRRGARPPGRGVDPAAGSARGRGPAPSWVRPATPTEPPSRRGPARCRWPVHGPITSPFGMRVHPVTGVYKLHTGTDLGVPCGTPVHVGPAGRRRAGRLEQRLRLAHRGLPRRRRRRAAHDHLQPPDAHRRRRSATTSPPGS